jgi:hypothetical protein
VLGWEEGGVGTTQPRAAGGRRRRGNRLRFDHYRTPDALSGSHVDPTLGRPLRNLVFPLSYGAAAGYPLTTEIREEERKGNGATTTAVAGISTPGMNLKNLVSREYFGHKKKVTPLCVPQYCCCRNFWPRT